MSKLTKAWVALACAVASGAAVAAPPNPQNGAKIARHWCSSCHIVADDQARGTDNVPTFAAIAATPGLDASRIAKFLADPHPKMPDMQLSRSEAADLAAYIASQRK